MPMSKVDPPLIGSLRRRNARVLVRLQNGFCISFLPKMRMPRPVRTPLWRVRAGLPRVPIQLPGPW